MKRLFGVIIPALICGMAFSGCDSNKAEPEEEEVVVFTGELQYVKTEFGGCIRESSLKSDESESEPKEHEVVVTATKESVRVFVGLNYICCAPFETNCETIGDVVVMYIIDACLNPYADCYCRCMCFYTFDFVFEHQGTFKQKYKIVLIDPREEDHVVISEGTLIAK